MAKAPTVLISSTSEDLKPHRAAAGVVVVIVAHRYGWVPDSSGPKSITRLECEEAIRLGKGGAAVRIWFDPVTMMSPGSGFSVQKLPST